MKDQKEFWKFVDELNFKATLPDVPQLMKKWPNRKPSENFEWWGSTPEESRRIRVSKPKHLYDRSLLNLLELYLDKNHFTKSSTAKSSLAYAVFVTSRRA